MRNPTFLDALLARDARAARLVTATGARLAERVEAAFDSATRNRGLLGRDGLDEDSALVIAPCNAIHTLFMRFAIDAVFVSRDGTVVKAACHLRPWRMAVAFRAFAVVELPAGTVQRTGLHRGDRLEVVVG